MVLNVGLIMKQIILLLLLIITTLDAQIKFEDYFESKTLRFDYFHTGDANSEMISFDEIIEEPYWGGSKKNLIDSFEYGAYLFKVWNKDKSKVLYSRGFSSLFREWQTTEEAKKVKRTLNETVTFPFPKDTVIFELLSRNKKGKFESIFEYQIDPASYFIRKDQKLKYDSFKVHYSGDTAEKLDILFLPDGYTAEEMDDFKKDCEKFKDYIFYYEPFKEMKDNINVWAVLAPSEESGTDIPGDNVWKNTLLNTTYYTFDSERYLMTYDYKVVRDLAANAPYDQIYILVNSSKYGGGAIYNYYSVTAAKNEKARQIFIHEFGHGFGGLADEYYTSDVSYQDFYPTDIEPWEPNITTRVNFERKWKDLLTDGIPLPTPNEPEFSDVIGLFEGGGYVAHGVYRPTYNSIMKAFDSDEFNIVCKNALKQMILFYSE